VIKIFKNRYVIVEHIGILSGRKFFRCPYYVNDRTRINLSWRYTLIEIFKRFKEIHEEDWKVFRIGRKGKLKRFI